jgi:hypothetical protein
MSRAIASRYQPVRRMWFGERTIGAAPPNVAKGVYTSPHYERPLGRHGEASKPLP